MAKLEVETEMTCVELVLWQRKKPITIENTFFSVVSQRAEFSWFMRSWRSGWPGYGAGCSFLMDFNILPHLNFRQGFRSWLRFCPLFVRTWLCPTCSGIVRWTWTFQKCLNHWIQESQRLEINRRTPRNWNSCWAHETHSNSWDKCTWSLHQESALYYSTMLTSKSVWLTNLVREGCCIHTMHFGLELWT